MNNSEISTIDDILIIGLYVSSFFFGISFLLGLFISLVSKHKIGGMLMKFGRILLIPSVSFFALLVIRLGYYAQGLFLFAVIPLGLLLRKCGSHRCPCCGEPIKIEREWAYFTKLLFLRKSAYCESCGARLIRAKRGWQMVQSGIILILGSAILRFMDGRINDVFVNIMSLVGALFFFIGVFTSRFEVTN